MSRLISLIVLLAIAILVGAVFYKVMASFILPMFLAVILVVIFGPLHHWFLVKFQGKRGPAAGFTTEMPRDQLVDFLQEQVSAQL